MKVEHLPDTFCLLHLGVHSTRGGNSGCVQLRPRKKREVRYNTRRDTRYNYHSFKRSDVMLRNPTTLSLIALPNSAGYLLLVLLLSACQVSQPQNRPAPELPPVTTPQAVKIDPIVLHSLLDQADQALARGDLTFPDDRSAYSAYQAILAIEPEQADAIRGLEHIVEQYIVLALQALERDQLATARSMLARASLVMPEHPSIEPTTMQIRLVEQAERASLKMSQHQLSNPTATGLTQQLATLSKTPKLAQCRFIISAKNDAQGRWIYQQLANGAKSSRIRADIKIRLPAGVQRLCFPS